MRGETTVFSTYLDGLAYARKCDLPTFEAVPINFRVTNDGTIDFKMTAATSGFSLGIRTFLRQLLLEIRFMKRFRPDIVVSDSRASSLLAARMMRIPVILMLNQFRVEIIRKPSHRQLSPPDRLFFLIANLGWLFVRTAIQLVWGRAQVILIPDLPAPYTISQGNLAIPRRYNSKVKLVGPIVETESSSIHYSTQGLRRKLGLDIKKPVIYAAVSGPRVERKILTQILLKALSPAARKNTVILSKGDPEGSTLPQKSKDMLIYDWIPKQDDFIKASDVVVSRAGHGIIMKSIMYGKPMILVPIPDHTEQYANARRAEVLGIAKTIDQSKLNRALNSAISDLLLNQKYSKEVKRIRKSASSMQAVKVTCDLIEDLASREIPRLQESQPGSD